MLQVRGSSLCMTSDVGGGRSTDVQSCVIQAQKLQTSLSIRLRQQQQQPDSESSGSLEEHLESALKELVGHIQTSWGVCLRLRPAERCALGDNELCERPSRDVYQQPPL